MISIFAKQPYRTGADKHLGRVSSMIRGDQIADQIGARYNPAGGYEKDVCIYVKPHVKPFEDFHFEGRPYMDIIDGWGLIPLMLKHPEVPVIACSKQDNERLCRVLKNKVITIPQHHCNYGRLRRTRNGVSTVGAIGTMGAFPLYPEGLKEKLAERGIELLYYSQFSTRQDIIDFYMKIDVQIIWRPYRMQLSNPLKLVNASSFGVPTIAFEESVFHELSGCYIPVQTREEFLEELDKLITTPGLYEEYSKRCIDRSEYYYIENIGKMYLELDT